MVGVPLMVIAAVVSPAVAVGMLVVLGVGYALIEVAGLSLLQRLNSDEVLGRAFAVVESSYWITDRPGRAPGPRARLPARLAGRAAGRGRLPAPRGGRALARAHGASRRRRSCPSASSGSARAVGVRAAADGQRRERCAPGREGSVGAGEVVIREGERGDWFYVVAEGMLDMDSGNGAPRVGRGDVFGEIALLRGSPRTATVTARDEAVLYSWSATPSCWP